MAIAVSHPVIDAAGAADSAVAVSALGSETSAIVSNPSSSAQTVYLGPANVTAPGGANPGFPLAPGEQVSLDLEQNEHLYAVTAAGSATLDVLQNRLK